ncbi:MAG: hypothetical protein H6839_15460 [Planctomycetes bacterium]|nr:hypothetical protein [Planctomycetota bacterium]
MVDEPAKPISKGLNVLRWTWGILLFSLLLFSILMAAWGDLREGLMLKILDDRYVKSFTIQVPEGAKVWVGTKYLGESKAHPLGIEDPDGEPIKVEGMDVTLPRVYLFDAQLKESSIACEPSAKVEDLLKQLVPEETLVWAERDTVDAPGFTPALLKFEDGRFDFVNLARVDWPEHGGGSTRLAFVMRVTLNDVHVFMPEHTEIWTDQVYADEGEFWAKREQWDDFPPRLTGQTKTVWRWFMKVSDNKWLTERVPGDYTKVEWLQLSEKTD